MQESTKEQENLASNYPTKPQTENIVLYQGVEISKKTGTQYISGMQINDTTMKKYNTTYYNYENGKYEGSSVGTFGEETYEGVSIVNNVKKIAMTQKYDAIPREYKVIQDLPTQLQDMADYSSVTIHEIDLDGDSTKEHLVCYTVDYAKNEMGDGNPQASSAILLLDSDYKKIADLVSLDNGFWANQKEEDYKIFLSLDDVNYIDLDNDGIMEVIVEVPTYEGTKISIIKYSNGVIDGQTNVKASLLP